MKGKLDISWDKIQDSLLNDQMKETISLIGSILESLKQFDMPEIEYLTPRPILILLLKKTQEYIDKQNNLNKEPIEINETEFEDDKKIGQYALNVYGASWAWMGDPKDAALKMGLSPGLFSFSFLSLSFLFAFSFLFPAYFLSAAFECLWSILVWMGDSKDPALKMGLSPGLLSFLSLSFLLLFIFLFVSCLFPFSCI